MRHTTDLPPVVSPPMSVLRTRRAQPVRTAVEIPAMVTDSGLHGPAWLGDGSAVMKGTDYVFERY